MADATLSHIAFQDAAGRSVHPIPRAETIVRCNLQRILEKNVLCSIATVNSPSRAHISTAHFCYSSDLVIYFLSHPSAQHCVNLRENPSAAVTVFSSNQRWGTPGRGVQLFGTCRRARGRDVFQAERLYAKRYPAYRQWRASAGGDAGGEYRFYRLEVAGVKLMDERVIGDGIFACAGVRRS